MDKTSITTIKKKNYCKMLFQDLEGQTEKNIRRILNLFHNLYDKKMYSICIAQVKDNLLKRKFFQIFFYSWKVVIIEVIMSNLHPLYVRNIIPEFTMTIKKLPTSGDLVGVTPHPSDPAQAFPHISYPHWGILMWEGPLPNNLIWIWKAWVYLSWYNCINGSIMHCVCNNPGSNPLHIYIQINKTVSTLSQTQLDRLLPLIPS